ncbi:MAG: TetR/AcrR family transcriptional regulator [Bacteroidales bacterium]
MSEGDRQTEEKIFEAAELVFEEKGMDGARMQDIADRAGINKALLHYYYRTKDLLFEAVFQKLAGRMFEKFAPVFSDKLTLEEKIRCFFNEHISFLADNPLLPSFILNEINRHPERMKKIISHLDFAGIWMMLEAQHKAELEEYNLTRESLPQVMTSIVAMSVFPFAARGILEGIFEKIGVGFDDYIKERKSFAADFVIGALKQRKTIKNQ